MFIYLVLSKKMLICLYNIYHKYFMYSMNLKNRFFLINMTGWSIHFSVIQRMGGTTTKKIMVGRTTQLFQLSNQGKIDK